MAKKLTKSFLEWFKTFWTPETAGKRNKEVKVRFNEAEYQWLEMLSDGITNSRYLRELMLGERPFKPRVAKALSPEQTALLKDLNGGFKNLNQLTKHANINNAIEVETLLRLERHFSVIAEAFK